MSQYSEDALADIQTWLAQGILAELNTGQVMLIHAVLATALLHPTAGQPLSPGFRLLSETIADDFRPYSSVETLAQRAADGILDVNGRGEGEDDSWTPAQNEALLPALKLILGSL